MTAKKRVEFDLSQFVGTDGSEMAALLAESSKDFSEGSIIKGNVLAIRGNDVMVDVGYKSEGIVSAHEFEDISTVKVGDEIDVLLVEVENENGVIVLSKQKADEKLRWDAVLEKYEEGSVVKGTVCSRVRGGLIVTVDGVDAFLPGSQIDVMPVHNTDPYVGNEFDFKILKISAERRNIILSRRELIEEQMVGKKRELLASIEKGQKRTGKVKNITDFGVFVDLTGLDGLLHITDMSWGRIKHPSRWSKWARSWKL